MFLHTENQQLLWNTLQKSPYLIEFTQKFAGYREEWFRGTVEQFYTQWISQNNPLPSNARELLEINKHALQAMVADLKRLLGYSGSLSTQNIVQNTYDVNAERKQREDAFSANFNKYQTEYNQLLERPAVVARSLPSESGGEKIKNMDDLLKEHARIRDMDLEIYAAPPPPQKQKPHQIQMSPRLKIMDEIERIEMQIDNDADANAFYNNNNNKSVRFSNEISSNSQ